MTALISVTVHFVTCLLMFDQVSSSFVIERKPTSVMGNLHTSTDYFSNPTRKFSFCAERNAMCFQEHCRLCVCRIFQTFYSYEQGCGTKKEIFDWLHVSNKSQVFKYQYIPITNSDATLQTCTAILPNKLAICTIQSVRRINPITSKVDFLFTDAFQMEWKDWPCLKCPDCDMHQFHGGLLVFYISCLDMEKTSSSATFSVVFPLKIHGKDDNDGIVLIWSIISGKIVEIERDIVTVSPTIRYQFTTHVTTHVMKKTNTVASTNVMTTTNTPTLFSPSYTHSKKQQVTAPSHKNKKHLLVPLIATAGVIIVLIGVSLSVYRLVFKRITALRIADESESTDSRMSNFYMPRQQQPYEYAYAHAQSRKKKISVEERINGYYGGATLAGKSVIVNDIYQSECSPVLLSQTTVERSPYCYAYACYNADNPSDNPSNPLYADDTTTSHTTAEASRVVQTTHEYAYADNILLPNPLYGQPDDLQPSTHAISHKSSKSKETGNPKSNPKATSNPLYGTADKGVQENDLKSNQVWKELHYGNSDDRTLSPTANPLYEGSHNT